MQWVVRTVEDAEHGEPILLVQVVEDVVVVDGEVVAAADALQQRGPRRVGVVGERDDGLPDVAQRALGDGLELAVGAVGDVEARRHHAWGIGSAPRVLEGELHAVPAKAREYAGALWSSCSRHALQWPGSVG